MSFNFNVLSGVYMDQWYVVLVEEVTFHLHHITRLRPALMVSAHETMLYVLITNTIISLVLHRLYRTPQTQVHVDCGAGAVVQR